MRTFIRLFILITVWLVNQSAIAASAKTQTVAIQPIGTIDLNLVKGVERQLKDSYGVDVVVKAACPLPKAAYYPPRKRYRAEKLLSFLETTDRKADKVLGLTTVDISTTKGKYFDWGVLGYGAVSGRPCVVSTFRMRGTSKPVSEEVFKTRFSKVVAHELGHTYGLDHCPVIGCLMEDGKGSVKTVDRDTDFCPSCRSRLRSYESPSIQTNPAGNALEERSVK